MNNFEEIYIKYIYATKCELCNKQFKNTKDRQMEHCHKTGEFRNIVCNRCNCLKADNKIYYNNTSGHKGISKLYSSKYKQGYTYEFRITINGKVKLLKTLTDFNKIVKFAEQWKKDNNYYT